jgi:hypothetical protein
MGYDPDPESSILQHIEDNQSEVSKLLEGCQFSPGSDQERPLLAFGEEVIVHSIEHAVSMWTAEEAVGSGSFELWYDVNFQTQTDETAEIGIFDSIQGGAGVASEVELYLSNAADIDIEHGLADQTACHTAAADAAILTLLAGGDGDTLYELAQGKQGLEQTEAFEDALPKPEEVSGFNSRLVRAIRDEVNGSIDAYNHQDLVSHTENRIRSLFETRELARFNAYVTTEHETVEDLVDRPPRAVDLLLHLSRHLFTDPRVRETYQRFADDASGRDISELGERLTALALQCRTACPDCLETDVSQCVHGTRYQRQLLDRRLLSEVCTYDS